MLKTQQWFKSEKRIVFAEESNKIDLSSHDHRKIQSIDLIETYAYGTTKNPLSWNEKIKCNNIRKQYKNYQFW